MGLFFDRLGDRPSNRMAALVLATALAMYVVALPMQVDTEGIDRVALLMYAITLLM